MSAKEETKEGKSAPKQDKKTKDPTKVKSSSKDKDSSKLDTLLSSMSEIKGNLTQLASDFYGNDDESYPPSQPARRNLSFARGDYHGYGYDQHGYDDQTDDWRQLYHDYEDDMYEDDVSEAFSHDYSYNYDDEYPEYGDADQSYSEPVTSTPKNETKSGQTPRKRPRQDDNNEYEDETVEEIPDKEMQAIAKEYEDCKPRVLEDCTTDPMPGPLASTLETWMWKKYNTDEIKKAQEKARRCSNATALIPLKIEEEVFYALDNKGKALDARYRFIQNALMKGCQPIANAWQKIITGITHMQRHRKDDDPMISLTPDFFIDIMQIKAELDLGLQLLGMANSQLGFRRRFTLRRHIAPGYKRLCDDHHPMNQWMFGGNIKATIEDMTRVNRMMADAQADNYRGRGRFLGGR